MLNFEEFLSLNSLNVGYTLLRDEELATIASLKNLTELDISGNAGITDTGLSYLSSLINLKSLLLNDCRNITDKGLWKLSSLKSLNKLLVSLYYPFKNTKKRNNNITINNIKKLKSVNFKWTIELIEDDRDKFDRIGF
jgi:hypothetical protein